MKRVSRNDPRPLYKQVKSHILDAIESGEIPAQTKISSERELVEELGVSRITIRQAMKELVFQGHLHSQPGKGFYATGHRRGGYELELLRSFTETAHTHGQVPGSRLLGAKIMPAPPTIATSLEIAAACPVIWLKRLRLLDGRPVAIAQDWLAVEKTPGLLALDWTLENRSLYAEIRTRYGLRPHHGVTVLSATLATPEECQLLDLVAPAAVLCVEQIASDAAGQPINLTYSTHDPITYPLRLEQGIV